MRHYDILRIGLLDDPLPGISVAVGRVCAELFVLGDDDLLESIARDLLCQSTIFIARQDSRDLKPEIFSDALCRRDRFKRGLVEDAVFVFDEY